MAPRVDDADRFLFILTALLLELDNVTFGRAERRDSSRLAHALVTLDILGVFADCDLVRRTPSLSLGDVKSTGSVFDVPETGWFAAASRSWWCR